MSIIGYSISVEGTESYHKPARAVASAKTKTRLEVKVDAVEGRGPNNSWYVNVRGASGGSIASQISSEGAKMGQSPSGRHVSG